VRPLIGGSAAFRRIAEAAMTAKHSVWVTVAFVEPDFALTDDSGTVFDLLDNAAARGVDVRVLFWRPNKESSGYGATFDGEPGDHDCLHSRGSTISARWDRAPGPYCQHQKSWLIDAGEDGEIAFVGGINLTSGGFRVPGVASREVRHDTYVEVLGPAASDVHHNFVRRWNEASERKTPGGVWGPAGNADLAFPTTLSSTRGSTTVQVQRTMPANRDRDNGSMPHHCPVSIADGERTVYEQYLLAIDAAERTIYIENQAIPVLQIIERLERALQRGVTVAMVVPSVPEGGRPDARRQAIYDQLRMLAPYPHFLLAGLSEATAEGSRRYVYVHSKTMIVDDTWATIGSCNLHAASLFSNSELNVSFANPVVVRRLRCDLFSWHLSLDTSSLDDRAALRRFSEIAESNRLVLDSGGDRLQGRAFRLCPERYGAFPA
jgi:phosphatidylserine/phosphatidylglycerophosphate/cardiolipin synthase-like enzyme